jgi:hypothetical protein
MKARWLVETAPGVGPDPRHARHTVTAIVLERLDAQGHATGGGGELPGVFVDATYEGDVALGLALPTESAGGTRGVRGARACSAGLSHQALLSRLHRRSRPARQAYNYRSV